jgi:hypothetical protein
MYEYYSRYNSCILWDACEIYASSINAHSNKFNIFVVSQPLWSSAQSSWLKIQRSGFDSRRYQVFWEVVGLERGPLSLVSTTEELLEKKNSGSGLESRDYCVGIRHADHVAQSVRKVWH